MSSSPRYRNLEVIKSLGERIRQRRIELGLSQENLAFKCNTDLSQINRIELGKVNTSVSHLFLIAAALDIPPKELVDFDVRIDVD